MKNLIPVEAIIAAAASLSGAVDLRQYDLAAIITPSGWDAADITLAASATEGGTYIPVHNNSDTELTYQAGASRYVSIDPDVVRGIQYVKVRSGTAGAPVAQADAVTVTLMLLQR